MKEVLITGGAGFIGSHAVERFLEDGYRVTVLDIKPQETATNIAHLIDDISYVEGDICNREIVETLINSNTHVLHLAAIVSVPESIKNPVESHRTNVDGTLVIFDVVRQTGAPKVVFASSAAVYGDTKVVPTSEQTKLQPQSPYALHKKLNEEYASLYAEVYGVSYVGLRFFNVYGIRQDPLSPYSGVITIFNKKIKAGESVEIFGDGEATRDFIHVKDVVGACFLTLNDESVQTQIFNVGTGKSLSINTVYAKLAELYNFKQPPSHLPDRKGDIKHSCADISKIKNELNFNLGIDFSKGISDLK